MFLGEYQHSLDAKGRVILPAKFRDQLEGGAVMARALDGCLAVYPVEEFQRVADEPAGSAGPRRNGAPGRAVVLLRCGRDHARQAGPGRDPAARCATFANLEREVIGRRQLRPHRDLGHGDVQPARRGGLGLDRRRRRHQRLHVIARHQYRTFDRRQSAALKTRRSPSPGPVSSPSAGAVVGPYSARFQPLPTRGDIPGGACRPGGWRRDRRHERLRRNGSRRRMWRRSSRISR